MCRSDLCRPLQNLWWGAFLEVSLELIDGSEVSYLISRPAVRSLLEGLALAENLARS